MFLHFRIVFCYNHSPNNNKKGELKMSFNSNKEDVVKPKLNFIEQIIADLIEGFSTSKKSFERITYTDQNYYKIKPKSGFFKDWF